MLSDVRGWRVSEWSRRSIFIFLLKKKFILILLARNLPFDSDVRQWSHCHCIVFGLNRKMSGQFECDMTLLLLLLFGFCLISFIHNARCGCCSIVCLRLQVMQIKQVESKMSKKHFFKKKHFGIFLYDYTHKNVKSRKSR